MANTNENPAPKKSGSVNLMLLGVVGLLAAAAGGAAPLLLMPRAGEESHAQPQKGHGDAKLVVLPFDPVVVNLTTDRLTRYLRVKMVLVVNEAQKHDISEAVAKKQAFLKSWLISYLADQTMADVTGAAGVNRVRRDIQDRFNAMLFPEGEERIRDILFEEFLIQ